MKAAAFALCFFTAFAFGVILERKPFNRTIPADKLRDYPGLCFASTQCKLIKPNESWPLKPYCGLATCRLVEVAHKDKPGEKVVILAEEVMDCGPLVDLNSTKGCKLVEADKDVLEKAFPDCCPQYDCEANTEVVYVNATAAIPPQPLGEKKAEEKKAE